MHDLGIPVSEKRKPEMLEGMCMSRSIAKERERRWRMGKCMSRGSQ